MPSDRAARAESIRSRPGNSWTEMTEASDESFSIATKSLPNGGRMTRIVDLQRQPVERWDVSLFRDLHLCFAPVSYNVGTVGG